MPGFSIRLEAAVVIGMVRIERSIEAAEDGFERENVPGIAGDHEDGDEVHVVGKIAVGRNPPSYPAGVGVGVGEAAGGADLDAVERLTVSDDEVEAGGVAVGLGDEEAFLGRSQGELHLCPFAAALGHPEVRDHSVGAIKKAGPGGPPFSQLLIRL